MKNALIINAHQFYEGIALGKVNKTMVNLLTEELTAGGFALKHTEIEQGYHVDSEVEKYVWADLIILQSPVYWFGCPWIYKKYADEVFTTGLSQQKLASNDGRSLENPAKQYGTGGKLQGRKYMLSLTWNAPKEAFADKSQYLFAGKTVDDVFISNVLNYKFCGAEILPSFSCFNVVKAPDISGDATRLREHLRQFVL